MMDTYLPLPVFASLFILRVRGEPRTVALSLSLRYAQRRLSPCTTLSCVSFLMDGYIPRLVTRWAWGRRPFPQPRPPRHLNPRLDGTEGGSTCS